ncbi:hypothetical protein HK096_008555 [Nowakowskiella sp. JEL0078]|nr:hypothetical protein HK096_008555 [Nowakowskiella sp. JEL0078]
MGKIFLPAIGSRGDVQPFLALALSLLDKGHSVAIAAHLESQSLISKYSDKITYFPISKSIELILRDTPDGQALIGPFSIFSSIGAMQRANVSMQPVFESWFDDVCAAAETYQPDVIGFSTFAWNCGGPIIANYILPKKTPYILIEMTPGTPTSEFCHMSFPVPFRFMNLFSWRMFQTVTTKTYVPLIARIIEKKSLQNTPLGLEGYFPHKELETDKIEHVHAFSSQLLQRPKDWNEHQYVFGELKLRKLNQVEAVPKELSLFMQKAKNENKKIVYAGFGSMYDIFCITPEKAASFADTILVGFATAKIGSDLVSSQTRFIFHTYMRNGRTAIPSENALKKMEHGSYFLLDSPVSHDSLFPSIDLIVHHGGAGTTHSAIHAGKPAIIIPFWEISDQPFWGSVIETLGCGKMSPAWYKLTSENFAIILRDMLRRLADITLQTQSISAKMEEEHADVDVADLFNKILSLKMA